MKYILIILLILSSSLMAQTTDDAIEVKVDFFVAKNVVQATAKCVTSELTASRYTPDGRPIYDGANETVSYETVYIIGTNPSKVYEGKLIKFWENADGSKFIGLFPCAIIDGKKYYSLRKTTQIKFKQLSIDKQRAYVNRK